MDITASSTLADNLDHPLGPFLYTISCMHCMTVSLAAGGMGLGTMWGEQTVRRMLAEAGFTEVDTKHVDGDILNTYYIATRFPEHVRLHLDGQDPRRRKQSPPIRACGARIAYRPPTNPTNRASGPRPAHVAGEPLADGSLGKAPGVGAVATGVPYVRKRNRLWDATTGPGPGIGTPGTSRSGFGFRKAASPARLMSQTR